MLLVAGECLFEKYKQCRHPDPRACVHLGDAAPVVPKSPEMPAVVTKPVVVVRNGSRRAGAIELKA